MRVVISKTGRYVGWISLQVIPSVMASVLGGYLLAQLLPQQSSTSAQTETAKTATKVNDAPIVNDRAPIRVAPRKDTQAGLPPAEVKRAEAKPVETKPSEVKSVEVKPADVKPVEIRQGAIATAAVPEAKVAKTKPAATASMQVYTPEPYTPEADTPQVAAQPVLAAAPVPRSAPVVAAAPAPQSQAVSSTAPALPPPPVLAPVNVTASRNIAAMQPPRDEFDEEPARKPAAERSTGEQVFSTISNAAGAAANATGNTINWVIDLPGKLIGHDSQQQEPQQQASQPRRLM